MQLDGLRKANRFSSEPFDPSAKRQMLAFDALCARFADPYAFENFNQLISIYSHTSSRSPSKSRSGQFCESQIVFVTPVECCTHKTMGKSVNSLLQSNRDQLQDRVLL
jgi:hypothetical protein